MQEKNHKSLASSGASLLLLSIAFFCVFCENQERDIAKFQPLPEEVEIVALRELGERLFFDKRLSIDNSIACANCHIPALAFTDGDSVSTGVHGRMGFRNSPSLFNAVNQDKFMWDGGVKTLELQALVPLQDTNEMSSMVSELIPELAKVSYYDSMSKVISGESFNPGVLTKSLAAYQKSLYREDSRYDRWKNQQASLNEKELSGYKLFSEKLNCASCHTPPTFTNNAIVSNGLYGSYSGDPGRYRITGDSSDIGKFKVPSLRNVQITGPYMHDGSLKTLAQVIEHYNRGGADHRNKSDFIVPLNLTDTQKADLIAFLESLSDVAMENHWQKVFNNRY